MDLRYGNATADDNQRTTPPREYRCLECDSLYQAAGDPCPNCGARRRRYVGPLPEEQDGEDDSEATLVDGD